MIKELAKEYERQRKAGMATIIVEIVGYPNDVDFERNAPTCSVTVTPREAGNPLAVHAAESRELSRTSAREDRSFVVSVETVPGKIKRLFKRERPRTLEIVIRADPAPGWEAFYESSVRTVHAEAGKPVPVSVSLKPKSSRSRLDGGFVLDKPSYPKKSE